MCDTQVLLRDGAVWFAKNSDREPDEPQPVLRLPAVTGDRSASVRVSHIEIDQVGDRHGVILSQPAWCWGAEMGLNDQGVAIGNEAIFSRRTTLQPGLLGMDLVRLGLERAATAAQALEIIVSLLQRYGQGGPAGYRDRGFCYDSSFILADAGEAWVLETAGRDWAARRVRSAAAISNSLTIERDFDCASPAVIQSRRGFAQSFDTRLLPYFACSSRRQAASMACLTGVSRPSLAGLAAGLRRHRSGNEDPADGSNADLCMHATGFIRRHQTTGSMIVRLRPQAALALFTGASAPCLSIFRPVSFSGEYSLLTPPAAKMRPPVWLAQESLHRRALGDPAFRAELRATRDEVEASIFARVDAAPEDSALIEADRLAIRWQTRMLRESRFRSPRLPRFWRRLTRRDGVTV